MIYLPAHFSSDLKMVWKTTKRKPIIQAWCSSPPTSTCTRYPNYGSRSHHPWEHFGHSGSAFWAPNVNMLRHPIFDLSHLPTVLIGLLLLYMFFNLRNLWIPLRIYRYIFALQVLHHSKCHSISLIFSGLRVQYPPSQGFRGPLQLPPTAAVNLYRKSGLQFCYRKYQHGQHGMHEIAWVHLCSVFGLRLFPRHVDAFCLIFKTCWSTCRVFQAWSESKRSRSFRLRVGCCK